MYLPRSLLISSQHAGWNGIHLEYHRTPRTKCQSIELGYEAKEFKVNGRVHKDFVAGNVGICPANQSLSTQAYGKAELILLVVDSTKFA
jgi:AraC family transcriptional regulator